MLRSILLFISLLFLKQTCFSQSNPFKNESIHLTDSTSNKKQSYFSAGAGIITKFYLKDFEFDDGIGILLTFNVNNGISRYFNYSLGLDLVSIPGSKDGVAGLVNAALWFNLPASNKVTWLLGGGAGLVFSSNGREGGFTYDLLIGTKIMHKITDKNALGFETKYSLGGKFLSNNIFITF